MADEVFMDIPQVQKIGKDFSSFGDILDGVSKALQAIIMVLKATAWISFGSTQALATYLERIQPNFKTAAETMRSLSSDINSAINAYQNGDMTGSKHFVG
jgi:hypothetical protein